MERARELSLAPLHSPKRGADVGLKVTSSDLKDRIHLRVQVPHLCEGISKRDVPEPARDLDLPGAVLDGAALNNASLNDADFSLANLTNATNLSVSNGSAFYDADTDFTNTGFDPEAAGWVFLPEPAAAGLQIAALLSLACLRRMRERRSS